MSPQIAPRPRLQSRRSFLGVVPAAVGLVAAGGIRSVFGRSEPVPVRGGDPDALAPAERLHPPRLTLPAFTSSGAKGPGALEMSHPMEPRHSGTPTNLLNERDPLPPKGV